MLQRYAGTYVSYVLRLGLGGGQPGGEGGSVRERSLIPRSEGILRGGSLALMEAARGTGTERVKAIVGIEREEM